MKIHREGKASIAIASSILAASVLLVVLLDLHLLLEIIIALPVLILFSLVLWFFRIPNRPSIIDDGAIYAPADGKIVVIEKTLEPEYFKDERMQVSIFMSPLNVHQNVYPVNGEVLYTKYHKGDFLVAWHPKSSTQNERSTIVIKQTGGTEILVRQIAGAVARRICTYSKKGDSAIQNSEFGFIKFGSRVDVFLPLNAKIECTIGQISRAKQTILAKLG